MAHLGGQAALIAVALMCEPLLSRSPERDAHMKTLHAQSGASSSWACLGSRPTCQSEDRLWLLTMLSEGGTSIGGVLLLCNKDSRILCSLPQGLGPLQPALWSRGRHRHETIHQHGARRSCRHKLFDTDPAAGFFNAVGGHGSLVLWWSACVRAGGGPSAVPSQTQAVKERSVGRRCCHSS